MGLSIFARREQRRDMQRELSKKGKQVTRYIIRLMLYPDSPQCKQWKKDIIGFINDIDKVEGRDEWPSANFIKQCISDENDRIEFLVDQVKFIEGLMPLDISTSYILEGVEKYQDWISKELATKGIVDANAASTRCNQEINR